MGQPDETPPEAIKAKFDRIYSRAGQDGMFDSYWAPGGGDTRNEQVLAIERVFIQYSAAKLTRDDAIKGIRSRFPGLTDAHVVEMNRLMDAFVTDVEARFA